MAKLATLARVVTLTAPMDCRPAKATSEQSVQGQECIEIPLATTKCEKSIKRRMREKQAADRLHTRVQEEVQLTGPADSECPVESRLVKVDSSLRGTSNSRHTFSGYQHRTRCDQEI